MVEKLQELIIKGDYIEARNLANRLFEAGEQSETYWILNAMLYRIEGVKEAEYACISRGLQKNSSNYELYYMLGNYFRESNCDKAYLCYEQAEYYCTSEDDLRMIRADKNQVMEGGNCKVHPVSIVILSYNSKEILQGCIESIRNTFPKGSYELVIVDNASVDGVAEWLKAQEDIALQCNTENKGFAGGCNQGIEMAAEENDIMLLNNDTIVPPNAIFWLRMGLYERETVGAVGPLTNFAGNDQQIMNTFDTVEEYMNLAEQICTPELAPYENKVWLVGFAMMIKREALNRVGGLDARYEWGNYEDNDYGMKLTQAGYEVLLCYNSFIYHYGSLNMSKNKEKYLAYMEENRKKLAEKWGFDSTGYFHADLDLIAQMDCEAKQRITVLEIGCGWGATLARIKHLYPNAKVYGIEKSEKVAGFGRYLADIITGDIEKMELPFKEHMFDYILAGDVWKKLDHPEMTLANMEKYLKEEGKMITGISGSEDKKGLESLTTREGYAQHTLKYREKAYEYLARIDECLKKKTVASITEFIHIFQEKELLEHCLSCLQELSYAHIFSIITINEVQRRQEVSYLLNGDTVEELTKVLKKVEFRIWELEFERGAEAEQRLYDVMQQYHITPEAMSSIIIVSAMDKCNTFVTLGCIYLEHQKVEEAMSLLYYALEWFPENPEILQALAQLCRKTGRIEMAKEYEEKLTCAQQ